MKKSHEVVRVNAAVLRQKGRLRIESLEMEGPRPDEALVKIVAAGICRTDVDFCDEWAPSDGAVVLGHEGAGIVEAVGAKVKRLKRGDHVVLSYQSCGTCPQCRKGRPAHCRRLWDLNFGFQRRDGSNSLERSGVRGNFFGQSSFATYSIATERNAVKVPKSLPLELLAPLGCGIQTGAGTVLNSLKVKKGEGIAVIGTGLVGCAAIMAAKIAGADPIIGVDIKDWRLKMARELGATHAINNRRSDISARIRRIAPEGVDFVLEITGLPDMLEKAIGLLRPGGTVAIFSGADAPARLPGRRKAVSIIQGDSVPQQFIQKLIDLHRKGRFPFDRLVKFYEFRDINRAMDDIRHGSTVKPVIRMG